MRKTKTGRGKGKGIIPFAINTVHACIVEGFELVPVRDERDNAALKKALAAFNDASTEAEISAANDGLNKFSDDLFYEAVVLRTAGQNTFRTIDVGFPVGQAFAVKCVKRTYNDAQGNPVEGKALELATSEDLKDMQTTDNTWAKQQFDAAKATALPM